LLNKDLLKKFTELNEASEQISELTTQLEKATAGVKELTDSNGHLSEQLRTTEEQLTSANEQIALHKKSVIAMETRTHLTQAEHSEPPHPDLPNTNTDHSTRPHSSRPHSHDMHDHKGHSHKSRPSSRETVDGVKSHNSHHPDSASHKHRSSKSPKLVDASTDTDQDNMLVASSVAIEPQNIIAVHPPVDPIDRPDSQPSTAGGSKPKYISLLSINNTSGILNNARVHSSRHSAKGTAANAASTTPSASTPSKGILKNSSSAVFSDAPTNTHFRTMRRSFNDESESPSHSRHDPSSASNRLQQLPLPAAAARRPHTTGEIGANGAAAEGDIDMGSSRDRDTWQLPTSPQVNISRRNQPLTWQPQQVNDRIRTFLSVSRLALYVTHSRSNRLTV